jgi:hypothetical protein
MAAPPDITAWYLAERGIGCSICYQRGGTHGHMAACMVMGHLEGKRHHQSLRALQEAGLPVPPDSHMFGPGPVRHTLVGRCRCCSLSPDGTTRADRGYQMPPETWALHVRTPEHERRGGDGRVEAYQSSHPPGPHVRQPGDEW